jgi:hypothetical protein
MDLDMYPQIFGGLAVRTTFVLVAFFGSLAIWLEGAAAYGNETQAAVDLFGAQRSMPVEISNDPVKTFNDPNGFAAAQFGLPSRLDTMLRDGSVVPASPVCVWVTGDYGEDKGRNYLEGGMSAQFVFRKNAHYPLIVTVPASMAAGDEEYRFGPRFGYITTGVDLRVPLSFIPSRYGRWTVGSSADLCYYGTSVSEFVNSVGLHLPKIVASFSVDF